jgi:hypothetical protein
VRRTFLSEEGWPNGRAPGEKGSLPYAACEISNGYLIFDTFYHFDSNCILINFCLSLAFTIVR